MIRDSRPNALNKDVPSFLVYPDGSHSLGVISPAATRPEEDAGLISQQVQYRRFLTGAGAARSVSVLGVQSAAYFWAPNTMTPN